MTLPYENATSGKAAIDGMQKLLRGFGATSFGLMEDFVSGMVTVQFEWRERRITIQVSTKGYAAAWLREHPFSARMRISKIEHERRALRQASVSVCSILRDWVKGQVTAIQVGMLTFEGAFLGQIMLASGESVFERVTASNMLALPRPAP